MSNEITASFSMSIARQHCDLSRSADFVMDQANKGAIWSKISLLGPTTLARARSQFTAPGLMLVLNTSLNGTGITIGSHNGFDVANVIYLRVGDIAIMRLDDAVVALFGDPDDPNPAGSVEVHVLELEA